MSLIDSTGNPIGKYGLSKDEIADHVADPTKILVAIHNRLTELAKMVMTQQNHSENLEIEVNMLKEEFETIKNKMDKE